MFATFCLTVTMGFVIINTYRLVGLFGGIYLTKDNIIIAALRLFLLNGYKNVSLVDVAKEVGITKGGIYHYFDSKENLLQVAVGRLFERFEMKYGELFGETKSLLTTLQTVIVDREFERYLEQLLGIDKDDYRANHASLALEVMHSFPDFQTRLDKSHYQLLAAIEKSIILAQQNGEVRSDIDANTLAALILSIMSGQNVLCTDLISEEIRRNIVESLWLLIKS